MRLRLLVSLLAFALAWGAALGQQHGKVIEVTIPAPSLAGNLLGDPAEQIYLPAEYQTATSKRYMAAKPVRPGRCSRCLMPSVLIRRNTYASNFLAHPAFWRACGEKVPERQIRGFFATFTPSMMATIRHTTTATVPISRYRRAARMSPPTSRR